MHDETDPIHRALSPLRSRRWDRGDHVFALENELMETIRNVTPGRRFPRAALIAAFTVMLAGLGFAASEWWEHYTVVDEDLGDGTFRLTITDDKTGAVDFDEILENGTEVMQLEDGGYIIVEPVDDQVVDDVLDDLDDEQDDQEGDGE